MTRKDYERAVKVVLCMKYTTNAAEREAIIRAFRYLFESDNPRFDYERFRAACLEYPAPKAK